MTLKYRPATATEIFDYYRSFKRAPFAHWTVEMADRRTETGVRHKNHGRAKVQNVDGVPMVHHHGRLEEVEANAYIREDGTVRFVAALRLKGMSMDYWANC